MSIKKWLVVPAVVAVGFTHQLASARDNVYRADLLGSSEVPAVTTTGSGEAKVRIDLDKLEMRVEASFEDLIGNTAASHIHCCTALPFAGNVGVATELPSFTGFPLGVTSGKYDHTFDMSLEASYSPVFLAANGGSASTAFNALVMGLDAGKAYLNVHTSFVPSGEIRGLLSAVPEPSTYAMMFAGLALVFSAVRRKHGAQG